MFVNGRKSVIVFVASCLRLCTLSKYPVDQTGGFFMEKYKVVCCKCDREFNTTKYKYNRNKRYYCSNECYQSSKEIQCSNCGKTFKKDGYSIRKYTNHFCSVSCQKEHAGKNKLNIVKVCEFCGKSFAARSRPTKNCPFKYCSKRCHDRAIDTRCEVVCPVCKKTFLANPKNRKKEHSVYCSIQCKIAGKEPTIIEVIVGNILAHLNVKYLPQYRVGKYVCDYYLPNHNLIIECDGSYWHSIPKVQERDKRKNAYLKECKYKVLRLKESEIKTDRDTCVFKVTQAIGVVSHIKRHKQLSIFDS